MVRNKIDLFGLIVSIFGALTTGYLVVIEPDWLWMIVFIFFLFRIVHYREGYQLFAHEEIEHETSDNNP